MKTKYLACLILPITVFSCRDKVRQNYAVSLISVVSGEPSEMKFIFPARIERLSMYVVSKNWVKGTVKISKTTVQSIDSIKRLVEVEGCLKITTGWKNVVELGGQTFYSGGGLVEVSANDLSVIDIDDFQVTKKILEEKLGSKLSNIFDISGNLVGPGCIGCVVESLDHKRKLFEGIVVFVPELKSKGSGSDR